MELFVISFGLAINETLNFLNVIDLGKDCVNKNKENTNAKQIKLENCMSNSKRTKCKVRTFLFKGEGAKTDFKFRLVSVEKKPQFFLKKKTKPSKRQTFPVPFFISGCSLFKSCNRLLLLF
jgi:hypothetical protein